jgi:hypothetical protein
MNLVNPKADFYRRMPGNPKKNVPQRAYNRLTMENSNECYLIFIKLE